MLYFSFTLEFNIHIQFIFLYKKKKKKNKKTGNIPRRKLAKFNFIWLLYLVPINYVSWPILELIFKKNDKKED